MLTTRLVAEEPRTPYRVAPAATAFLKSAALPDARPPTHGEWIDAIRRGLPAQALDALTAALGLSQSEFAQALAFPERTLARRKKEGTLTPDESAKLVRVARAFETACEVFETPAAARDWLKSPNPEFADASPLSLLDTDIGMEAVTETLGRIAHGVFA